MPSFISQHRELQGYSLMFGSILTFSFLPYYLQFLTPMEGNTLFAYRVITQLGIGLLLLAYTKSLFELKAIFVKPKVLLLMCLTSPLIALQWWVFFWGAVNGETINIAMGYFLLPITISLSGRFILKEKMSTFLWMAVIAALLGVCLELFRHHSFSWVTLLICLGYPPYLILRKRSSISATSNFVAENILIMPMALLLLYMANQQQLPLLPSLNWGELLVVGAGFLGTIGQLFFVSASTRLNFTVFGMLNYGEPLLLMLVAILLLNESISSEQLWSYSCFAIAVLFVISDSLRRIRKSKRKTIKEDS